MQRDDISFFDPASPCSIIQKRLPHWTQAGVLCFVTWRAADSLPQAVLARLDHQIAELLRSRGLDPAGDWKRQLSQRDSRQRGEVQWKLFATRDKFLDKGYGECLLARSDSSRLIEDSLKKFDGERYFLTDAVVMPNHLHFIAAFADEATFLKQCTDWKRYMARGINRLSGRSGSFWQVDQFDHLIRSLEQFEFYRKYIAENPIQAGLSAGMFRHYQKDLTT